jgi:hypothetical protein
VTFKTVADGAHNLCSGKHHADFVQATTGIIIAASTSISNNLIIPIE